MENKITVEEARKIYKENNHRVIDDSVDGFVVLKDVNKIYNNKVQAVYDFNIKINKNEFIVLVGPSGCGKSTTLRMIAGLEDITSGFLYIDNVLSNYLESKYRNIAMVFQSYALYPNLNVYDNIAFGLKANHTPKDIIEKKVFEAAEILNLGSYLDRKPKELSGGQMQRVALGRAIVRDAKLFLMDEPLSNLDAKLRVQMRSEIVSLHKRVNATTIYVTHDQIEAMTMADRIVVMNEGLVQQIGTPYEIYNNPSNVFVATFIGNPPMNVLNLNLEDNKIKLEDQEVNIPNEFITKYHEHIENRVNYFKDLEKKVDTLYEERLAIIDKLKALYKEIKNRKINLEKKFTSTRFLLEEITNFQNLKGFNILTNDDKDNLINLINNSKINFLEVKKMIRKIISSLNSIDFILSGELKKFKSGLIYRHKEKEVTIDTNKKKKKDKKIIIPLYEENKNMIKELLSLYTSEGRKNNVLLGIRPEDIHFSNETNFNLSNKLVLKPYFIELLGSEYYIYFRINNEKVIMKMSVNTIVNKDDILNIAFDLNKLKIFDSVSGERIV